MRVLQPVLSRRRGARAVELIRSGAAGLLGAAPHVLHHVGPLAGAALLAGAAGKLVFGLLGALLLAPMLVRMHRRTGAWAVPALAFAAFMAIFALSTFLIGPALTGADGDGQNGEPAPRQAPAGHEAHHE